MSTGLLRKHDANAGRDAQSSAFFRTPGIPWLYSGVANTTPSLSRTSTRISAIEASAGSQSRSSL